ncbi:hypothetical protein MYSTI_00946 [Myxococcus stipitatus DSM 14675]|uniref:Uncharacterized protein n=1 Tax=Myxococcus stipitatus (strain DSM 14675 / JCM 12634 / Mx s8) TaxID=1278073 RepID=L7U367_MYXSD|nr:hypothetical protein [Myxococcus stipitatus]AGC42295.1 hypothetical protein MYSTI_00946 [Myxococcus stipitatus DSM 14675]
MPPPRSLVTLAGGVLLALIIGAVGLAFVSLRTGPLEERLVREVQALTGTRYTRPSHVSPPVPGTFARRMEPLLDPVLRLYQDRPKTGGAPDSPQGQPCRDVADGKLPVTSLPSGCEEALERARPLMAQVLEATHAEVGGLPEGMGSLAPLTPARANGKFALMYVVHLAALETRMKLSRAEASAALDTCLDALALSRELELGGGMEGQLLAATGHGVLYRPCADALDAAPLERKRRALSQLARLAEGFAPFSQTLRQESVLLQLVHFGDQLSEEAQAALPPGSRDIVPAELRALASPSAPPLMARRTWWKLVEGFDALTASADLPTGARRRAFALLEAEAEEDEAPLAAPRGPDVTTYGEYAERLDLRKLQHNALIALAEVDVARAERGQWPDTAPRHKDSSFVLEALGPMEARLEPCSRAYASQGLRVTADPPSTARP